MHMVRMWVACQMSCLGSGNGCSSAKETCHGGIGFAKSAGVGAVVGVSDAEGTMRTITLEELCQPRLGAALV